MALTITPQSTANSAPSSSSVSYTSQAIGSAASDRIVIVALYAVRDITGTVVSSATIGGVSATILKQQTNHAVSVDNVTAILAAAVPSGTTATVAITFNNSVLRCNIATFSMVGGSISPYATYANTNATDAVPDITIDVPAGGGHVAVVGLYQGSTTTFTWAGSGITEAYDVANTESFSAAYGNYAASASSVNVTATPDAGTVTRQSMCGVSFSAVQKAIPLPRPKTRFYARRF